MNQNMNKIIKKIFNKITYIILILKKSYRIIFRKRNTIFLFGSPFHSNMGDQAQTFCICQWFANNYPNYSIYIFRLTESFPILLKLVRKTIRKNDILVCHSGYHMTDLYHEQDVYCRVTQLFPDYPIIIFPQTVNYVHTNNLINTANIFNKHGKILLMCRDEYSYKTACKYFINCRLLLYPDIVTSLIGTKNYTNKRNGILFCMRNDKEAFYSHQDIQKLQDKLANINIQQTDTTLPIKVETIYNQREKILNEIFEEYSKYELIITDRYHGTIFSLIAGTPVIVVSSSDHKLSSGVKWFPKEFSQYIQFAQNLDEAYKLAKESLDSTFDHKLPAYFKNNYYDKLNTIIEPILNGQIM